MFLLDGKQLKPGVPFTGTDGTQYPANWLRLTTLEEKEAIGIVEVLDPEPYNQRFWAGRDTDGNLIPRQFGDVGPDPVSGIVTTGLQTQCKEEQNREAFDCLLSSDWYVTRYAETGAAIPVGITSFRTGVRSVCAERQDMIVATTSVAQLESLVTGAGTSSIVGYTTTLLPNWPNIQDYT